MIFYEICSIAMAGQNIPHGHNTLKKIKKNKMSLKKTQGQFGCRSK